ncbi:MAG TPA: fibronectin type III domain-containing protein [Niastella sp.]
MSWAPPAKPSCTKNPKGAVAYVHQYSTEPPGPNTVWHSEGSTTGNYTFTGLYSDKRYWFRVVAVGRKGQKALSPVISRSIQ